MAAALFFLNVSPVQAAHPGKNGEIALNGSGDYFRYGWSGYDLIWHFYQDGSWPRPIGPGPDNPQYVNENFLQDPEYSPNGRRIAFTAQLWNNSGYDIWTSKADGSDWKRITNDPAVDEHATWGPGKIAFVSHRSGYARLYISDSDGSNTRVLWRAGAHVTDPSWSPDGDRIAFVSTDNPSTATVEFLDHSNLWTIRPDGTGLRKITEGDMNEEDPDWSPDGERLLFERWAWVDQQVQGLEVVSTDRLGDDLMHVKAGARDGAYSPDGRFVLFFLGEDQALYRSRPDGTRMQLIRKETDQLWIGGQPSWQPWHQTRESSIRFLWAGITQSGALAVQGEVLPRHAYQKVVFTLRLSSSGRLLKKKAVLSGGGGRFRGRFAEPQNRDCVARFRFVGDADHLPASRARRVRC
jgi:dipeptidyl aminopeptidase/acylaminoacyl peptidase